MFAQMFPLSLEMMMSAIVRHLLPVNRFYHHRIKQIHSSEVA